MPPQADSGDIAAGVTPAAGRMLLSCSGGGLADGEYALYDAGAYLVQRRLMGIDAEQPQAGGAGGLAGRAVHATGVCRKGHVKVFFKMTTFVVAV